MFWRNRWLAGILLVAFGILAGWFGRGLAASGDILPGSEQDPLVSRSYVESRLRLNVVEVPAGKQLIGRGGSEMIVRSGTATIIDSSLGGVSDVTAGRDLRKGEEAPRNHLLIIPRDDGRGILATTPAIVLVRGGYEIK